MLHCSTGLILILMQKTGKTFAEIRDFLKLVDETIDEIVQQRLQGEQGD